MRSGAKQIVEKLASAIASASTYNDDDLRQAAKYIRGPSFAADADERPITTAFAEWLEMRADRREKAMREKFGEK